MVLISILLQNLNVEHKYLSTLLNNNWWNLLESKKTKNQKILNKIEEKVV